jgi:hypothetical protein
LDVCIEPDLRVYDMVDMSRDCLCDVICAADATVGRVCAQTVLYVN